MMRTRQSHVAAASIGMLLTLPLAALEWANRQPGSPDMPVVLYGLLWLVASAIAFLMIRLVRQVAGASPFGGVAMTIGVAVFLLVAWAGIVADQWSCFFGMTNCD